MNPYMHLENQHEEIKQLLKDFKNLITPQAVTNQTDELVKMVNTLAGKLRIHMGTEDRYLYPELSKHSVSHIKATSEVFNSEMLSLHDTFNQFKLQYNTRSKILNDPSGFIKASSVIESQLMARILKEDKDLYPYLKQVSHHDK